MSRRLLVASLCVAAACVLPLARAADVLSIINANPQFSLYASLLQSTALDKGLTGNGPYSLFGTTVCVPARTLPPASSLSFALCVARLRV